MQPIRYADLVFQPDMLSATRDDGTVLRLTRQERALILQLTRQPNRLVTRPQLLEGLGDLSGELNERNIDYLINRLRKRLGDSARAPRFIATQYGEGYSWVTEPIAPEPVCAFLLVGPVYGLGQDSGAIAAIVDRLAKNIGSHLGTARNVVCLPKWRFEQGAIGNITHSLEVSLLPEGKQIHLALALRDGHTNTLIESFRLTLSRQPDNRELASFAQSLIRSIWSHAALSDDQPSNPTDRPMHLRLHDAGMLISADTESWQHNTHRLEEAYAENPDDPALAILLALNGYVRLIHAPLSSDSPISDAGWRSIEDDMERLALGALPKARDQPMHLLGIAKVLRFINRGYLQLAARLTDDAFQTSTAFAAAFAMKGQIAASQGDIGRAIDLYDRAIELSQSSSQFHIYLLVLKGAALLAADRRGDVAQLTAELYALDPVSRIKLGLFFVSPKAKHLPPALKPVLATLTIESGQRMLMHFYRITARQFEHRHHQKNVLKGVAVHLVNNLGPHVMPVELQKRFPELTKGQKMRR